MVLEEIGKECYKIDVIRKERRVNEVERFSREKKISRVEIEVVNVG